MERDVVAPQQKVYQPSAGLFTLAGLPAGIVAI
jgi:hypothetical protein